MHRQSLFMVGVSSGFALRATRVAEIKKMMVERRV